MTTKGWQDLADPVKGKVDEIESVSDDKISSAANAIIDAAVKAREKELDQLWEALTEEGDYSDVERPPEWHAKRSDYEWIPKYFEPFYARPLNGAGGMADSLKNAKATLESGKTAVFTSASDEVGKWAGKSRDAFKELFLDPFPNAINNQKQVIDELRAGMYLYEGIQRTGRKNARDIAVKTREALEPEGFSLKSSEAKLLYSMVGIVAALMSALISPTLGLATGTLAIVSATANSSGAFATAATNQPPVEISGHTVELKLQSMVEKLNTLQTDMFNEEAPLAQALGRSTNGVEKALSVKDPRDLATLLPNEPGDRYTDLTDGKKPSEEEFHPPAEAR